MADIIRLVEVRENQVRATIFKLIAGLVGDALIDVGAFDGKVDKALGNIIGEVVVDGIPADNAARLAFRIRLLELLEQAGRFVAPCVVVGGDFMSVYPGAGQYCRPARAATGSLLCRSSVNPSDVTFGGVQAGNMGAILF